MKKWSLISLVFVCSVMFLVGCNPRTQVKTEKPADTKTPKLDAKIYSYKTDSNGFDTKNFFYDNGKEVVVFDSQFTGQYAQKSIDFIRSKTKSPIKYLVITHPNPDKFNGMKAFQAIGAKVIASNQTNKAIEGVHKYKQYYFVKIAKMFTEKTYPQPGKVDIVFDKSHTIELSDGDKVELTELGTTGVSSNQTIAYIPSKNAYLVGDLVHHQAHAWLEGGIVNGQPSPDLQAWIQTLDQVGQMAQKDTKAVIYGGRGESAPAQKAIDAQKAYLKKAEQIVGDYVKGLGDKKGELKTDKANAHYTAIEKEFVKAFPSYKLSYMIRFGVYGLALSKLQ